MLDGGIILLIAVPSLTVLMWTYLVAKRASSKKQQEKKRLIEKIYRPRRH